MLSARAFAIAAAIAVMLVLAEGATAAPFAFAPDSYVNTPLASNAPIDPASTTMVQRVVAQAKSDGTAVGWQSWSSPLYVASASQPTVTVTPNPYRADIAAEWAAVPLPPDAQGSPDSEAPLVVYQPSSDTMWEFIGFHKTASGAFEAYYGGKMANVSTNPGYWLIPDHGVTATGIPIMAGLQRISELQAGQIDHSIGFAMPRPAPCWRWPAHRQDRVHDLSVSDALAPPEGSILRLPANLDIASLHLPRYTEIVARAVQKYGMVLRDRGGDVGFWAEEYRGTGTNPYTGGTDPIFQGMDSSALVAAFPWDKLQVLAPPAGTSGCQGLGS